MAEPKGRPTRARDKLRNNFLHALAEDFTAHGAAAIVALREKDPGSYIRAIASLMPKEMDIKHQVSPLEHLSDEQLQQIVDAAERVLVNGGSAAADPVAIGAQPPEGVPPLH